MELWGGLECTVNRVGNRFHDQFAKSGHLDRPHDLDLVAGLGLKTLRYPVLWERTAPDRPEARDWRFADERLGRLRSLGIAPIAGLVHHGSGPRYTGLLEDDFATGLAEHARAVAERYPWIDAYTPVNEPLTTARFSALYGHWYPHATDGRSFARALLNQVRATILSMAAIRRVNPDARLVQTDDLGKTHATEPLRYQADFDNERRWLGWDLLCGKVDRGHPLWGELTDEGVDPGELDWFLDRACPPDVVGVNYYLTSERFIDHRLDRYPASSYGANAWESYADVEAVRVLAGGVDGPASLLREAWDRYGLPLAITECHLGCTREEQVRWLGYVWNEAARVREEGADVRAVTVWSMFGAHDWCSLLTAERNRYEPGVFDLRAPEPRPTALARAVGGLAGGQPPAESGDGWWERPLRLQYPPVLVPGRPSAPPRKGEGGPRPSVLIVGAREGLGDAFAALCALRGLDCAFADGETPEAAIERTRPWAVVKAAEGLEDVARACARHGARLVAFSDARVFGGDKGSPYVEGDPVSPSRGEAERGILDALPDALVVRLGVPFGAWDSRRLVQGTLRKLLAGRPFVVPAGLVSLTCVPEMVHATLDLLIDGFAGPVHLVHEGTQTLADFARRTAERAGLDPRLVLDGDDVLSPTLASERAWVMPTLDDALGRALPDLVDEATRPGVPYLF